MSLPSYSKQLRKSKGSTFVCRKLENSNQSKEFKKCFCIFSSFFNLLIDLVLPLFSHNTIMGFWFAVSPPVRFFRASFVIVVVVTTCSLLLLCNSTHKGRFAPHCKPRNDNRAMSKRYTKKINMQIVEFNLIYSLSHHNSNEIFIQESNYRWQNSSHRMPSTKSSRQFSCI